jgi:hypothetical protein
MSRPEGCRIAATPADYQRYGIAKGEIAAWEDGFRTRPGGPGTFEWWYFDAVLDDGSTLVINFMVKDIRSGRGVKQPARPVVTFELDRLADDSSLVRFEKTGEHPDPVTGRPVADTTVYDYDATAHGGEHYRVTFDRENTIVQARMIESVKGAKRVLARIAGFDGAYMRFTGQVTVERIGSEPVPETVTAPALWELMYFGKTTA